MTVSFKSLFLSAVCLFCVGLSVENVPGRQALLFEQPRYNLNMSRATLFEALDEISRKTGVEIAINKNANQAFRPRQYRNQTVDQIIRDIFRWKSKALVWSFDSARLKEVKIYLPPDARSKDPEMVFFVPDHSNDPQYQEKKKAGDGSVSAKASKDRHEIYDKTKTYETNAGKAGRASSEENSTITEDQVRKHSAGGQSYAGDSSLSSRVEKELSKRDGNAAQPPRPKARHGLEPPPMPPGMELK